MRSAASSAAAASSPPRLRGVGPGQPDWVGPIARGVSVDTRYRYSADGELVEALDLARGTTEYRYDPVGQLLAMVPQQARQELFRFDPRGNLYEADASAPQRTYGKGNRLLQKGDTHYRWDDDGRLIEKRIKKAGADDEVWLYRWDAAGLLREVERPDGAVVRFAYDPFARRVAKEVREPRGLLAHSTVSRTRFVWDGTILAHEICEPAIEAEKSCRVRANICLQRQSLLSLGPQGREQLVSLRQRSVGQNLSACLTTWAALPEM